MEINITKKARDDLYNYYQYYKLKSNVHVSNYINEMLDYTQKISIYPNIGKIIEKINEYQIRQLIYKKHKILYINSNNKIYILRYIYTTRKFNIRKDFLSTDFINS